MQQQSKESQMGEDQNKSIESLNLDSLIEKFSSSCQERILRIAFKTENAKRLGRKVGTSGSFGVVYGERGADACCKIIYKFVSKVFFG
ncbi:MAG: hypothetical protein NT091_04655 [Candidatus Falkowbacteria bacterium]|nr:hypothetical protein [Candidatus Falkowbacteria bacterium]